MHVFPQNQLATNLPSEANNFIPDTYSGHVTSQKVLTKSIGYFRNKLRNAVLSILFIVAGFSSAYADCTITGDINASAFLNTYGGCTGRLVIPNNVTLTIDVLFTLPTSVDSIIIQNGGHIAWTNGPNKFLKLATNQAIIIYDRVTQGANAALNGHCSNTSEIHLGTVVYGVCTGGGACLPFSEIITDGGTIRINADVAVDNNGLFNACFDQFDLTAKLSGNVYRIAGYPRYQWTQVSGPGSSSFLPSQTTPQPDSTALVTVTAPGVYVYDISITNPLSALCSTIIVTLRGLVTVTVNPSSLGIHQDNNSIVMRSGSNFIFNNTSNCRRISIIQTTMLNGDVKGNVAAKVWVEGTTPTYAGKPYVKRHYEITPANGPAATARVTLYFTQQEFDEYNSVPFNGDDLPTNPTDAAGKASLRILKFAGSSSDGSGLPETYPGGPVVINPDDNDIVWNAVSQEWAVTFSVNGFSGFIAGNNNPTILPLSITQFNATLQNGANGFISWKTASADAGITYELQRSTDSRNFATIQVQNGTASALQFSYTDAGLSNGKYYYRLKMTDKQGVFAYSSIAILQVGGNQVQVMLYPNPVKKEALGQLRISISNDVLKSYRITDALGKVLLQKSNLNVVGSTHIALPQQLVTGSYYLQLITANGIKTEKIIVE